MLCFIQSENRVLFLEVILLFWICILKKIKSFGITKSYGFVYGSASGQVILSFLQQVLVHRVARAAGYLSTLTGNIGSGQNVSWPVVTRGNIGDDAALSRRIDVNITSLYNPMICGKIFRLGEASISSLALGTRRGNIGADAAL